MKTKKILSALLALTMVLSMPFYAFAEINQTVSAGFGEGMEQHITVNDNVNVSNEVNAVFVEAHAPNDADDKNASAEIKGDVTATNENSFSAVYAEGRNGDATVKITGDLSANSTNNANINGLELWGHSYNGTGYAYADIGGNITATSNGSATAIDNECGDVLVANDVIATGSNAKGIESYCEANIKIGKNVKSTGTGDVCGIDLYTQGEKQQNITVDNDVNAMYTSDSEYSTTDAVRLFGEDDSKAYAEFKGNVIASNTAGTATGLKFSDGYDNSNLTSSYYSIQVGNSIISDGYGIAKYNCTGTADIIVENEIKAKKAAVLLVDNCSLYDRVTDGSTYSANQLNLTAWKLNVNENGNVAELYRQNEEYYDELPQDALTAKDFEKKINYIIKAQQPTEYGTISFVDANGSALKKVNNYFVAHEGDKVVVKPNLKEGYQLKAAYNGVDEKLPLLTDANGNFYIIVPKGGGISISVEVEKAPEPVIVSKKKNPLNIKGKKVKVSYAKLSKSNRFISAKKAIKFVNKGKGKLSYAKIKGNKKIRVSKTTGRIIVKKGLKKGTYKVTVKVKAKGNADYKAGTKQTTVKIVVG